MMIFARSLSNELGKSMVELGTAGGKSMKGRFHVKLFGVYYFFSLLIMGPRMKFLLLEL